MRFKKGDKVEVFSKEEFVMGAWRCAEIISSYGDMCMVKYGLFPLINGSEIVVDRVPMEAVRPCPPPVKEESNWVKDDLIEVLDDFSWKRARVVKAMDDNTFVVRLFGLCEGFRVHRSHLRDRKCFQDGTWFLMERKFRQPMRKKTPYTRTKPASEKNDEILKPRIGSKKRRSTHSKLEETHRVDSVKKRSIQKNGSNHEILSVHPSPTCSSLIETSIYVDSDSCSSSVGSCTGMSSDAWNHSFGISKHMNNEEECSSDAESSCGLVHRGKGCPQDGKMGLEVHRPELHTYFSEVRTLYALGPLRWEDGLRLTDMRCLLRISTDEHLMVNISSAMSVHALFLRSQMMIL